MCCTFDWNRCPEVEKSSIRPKREMTKIVTDTLLDSWYVVGFYICIHQTLPLCAEEARIISPNQTRLSLIPSTWTINCIGEAAVGEKKNRNTTKAPLLSSVCTTSINWWNGKAYECWTWFVVYAAPLPSINLLPPRTQLCIPPSRVNDNLHVDFRAFVCHSSLQLMMRPAGTFPKEAVKVIND